MGTRTIVLALSALLVVIVGCRRDPARVTARRLENLQLLASRDLACPAVAIGLTELEEHLYRASGCNQWADYSIRGRGHRYAGASWQRVVPLAERAQAELGCPAANVAFEPVDARSYRVAGCGRSGVMSLVCGDLDCGWLLSGGAGGGTTVVTGTVVVVPATSP